MDIDKILKALNFVLEKKTEVYSRWRHKQAPDTQAFALIIARNFSEQEIFALIESQLVLLGQYKANKEIKDFLSKFR